MLKYAIKNGIYISWYYLFPGKKITFIYLFNKPIYLAAPFA